MKSQAKIEYDRLTYPTVIVIGGGSAAVLFLLFAHVASFRVLLYALIGTVGVLVGLEIPLLFLMGE